MTRSPQPLPPRIPTIPPRLQSKTSVSPRGQSPLGQIQRIRPVRQWGMAIASSLALLMAQPSLGAEAVNVTFRSVSFDIPLADLELLAKEGKVSPNLGFIKAATQPDQIDSLQALLQQRVEISPTVISQFLALPEGDILLARLGSLLAVDGADSSASSARSQNAQLLKETILRASVHPEGLSLINLVRQFPGDRLALDIDQVLKLISENADFYTRRPAAIQALRDEALRERIALPSASPEDLSQPGPLAWRKQPLTFRTAGRPSFSFADLYLPKDPGQIRLGQIHLDQNHAEAVNPQLQGKTPLVILSHGLGSNRRTLAYLAQHLASHGYGALVLEHNESNSDRFNRFLNGMAAPPSAAELLLRPRDITAALDNLTERAKDNPELARLNLTAVGVAGQSLGGYTALAAGGAPINRPELERYCPEEVRRFTLNLSIPLQCRILELPKETSLTVKDDRVKAVLAMNPLTSEIFGQPGLAKLDIPVMIVAGAKDYIAPALPEQLKPFTWLKTPHKYLIVANSGTHFSFLGEDGTRPIIPLPSPVVGSQGSLAQSGMKAMGLAFFNRHLRQEQQYSAYLNQSYLERFASTDFDYSLVERLPESPALLPR